MINLYENYIVPTLGQQGIDTLKKYILEEKHFLIPQKYHIEAQGIADGISDAGYIVEDFTYLDVLAANTFFDFIGFLSKSNRKSFGCSSLADWGDATASTELNGASVISRHVDWQPNSFLKSSNTIVAHIPSEEDEQPWIMIGFSGQISALSGVNNSSMAVFHHSLADFSGTALKNKAYEPVWFTARNALEMYDYNSDGKFNTNDLRDAVKMNLNGYANGSLLFAACETDENFDSLTALVCESACLEPYHTFRYNDYDDLVPGDNLYAANGSIKRNNIQNYEPRYMNIVNNIGDGTLIDDSDNWVLMRDFSNSSSYNIQFMQFIPGSHILKLSVADDQYYAYQKEPVVFLIDSLFEIPQIIDMDEVSSASLKLFPNPVKYGGCIRFMHPMMHNAEIEIIDMKGAVRMQVKLLKFEQTLNLNDDLKKGIYFLKITCSDKVFTNKLVIL